MEIEFEDDRINLKTLFLKVVKVSEFVIFKSKLFHSMTADGKKFLKYLALKSGMLSYSEGTLRRLTFKYFEKVESFSIPSYFTE